MEQQQGSVDLVQAMMSGMEQRGSFRQGGILTEAMRAQGNELNTAQLRSQTRMDLQRLQSYNDDASNKTNRGPADQVADLTRFSEASVNALASMPTGDLGITNSTSTPLNAFNPLIIAPQDPLGGVTTGGLDLIPSLDLDINPPNYNTNISGTALSGAYDKQMDQWAAQQRQLSSLASLKPQQQQDLLQQLQLQLQRQQQELQKIEKIRQQHQMEQHYQYQFQDPWMDLQQQQIAAGTLPAASALADSTCSLTGSTSTSPKAISEDQIQREIANALQANPQAQKQAAPPAYSQQQQQAPRPKEANQASPKLMFPTSYHLQRKSERAQAQGVIADGKSVSMPTLADTGVQGAPMQAQLRAQASAYLQAQPSGGSIRANSPRTGLTAGNSTENDNLQHQFSLSSQDSSRNSNTLFDTLSNQSGLSVTMGEASTDSDGMSSSGNNRPDSVGKKSLTHRFQGGLSSASESDLSSGRGGAANSSLSHSNMTGRRKPYKRSESLSSQSSQSSGAKCNGGCENNLLASKDTTEDTDQTKGSDRSSPMSMSASDLRDVSVNSPFGVSAPTGYLTTRAQAMAAAKEAVLLDVLDAKQKAKVLDRQQSTGRTSKISKNRTSNTSTPTTTPRPSCMEETLESTKSCQNMDTSNTGDVSETQDTLARASTLRATRTMHGSGTGLKLDIPNTLDTRKRCGSTGGGPAKSPLASPRSLDRLQTGSIGSISDLKKMTLKTPRSDRSQDCVVVSPLPVLRADVKPMMDLSAGISAPAALTHTQTLPANVMAPILETAPLGNTGLNNGLGHTSQPVTHTLTQTHTQAHPGVQPQLSAPTVMHTDTLINTSGVQSTPSPLPQVLAQVPQLPQGASVQLGPPGLHRVSAPGAVSNVHQMLVPRRGSAPYGSGMTANAHPTPAVAVAGAANGPFMFNTPASRVDVNLSRKSRIKKASHNAIERKRRYNINDRIKELQEMLPAIALSRSKIKQCKGSTLKRSIDYIRYLENHNEMLVQKMRDAGLSINMKSFAETEVEDTFADHSINEEKEDEMTAY